MRLKIRCDGESEKFYKIFLELNKAQDGNKLCILDKTKHVDRVDILHFGFYGKLNGKLNTP